jgi:hypothetical protein
MPAVIAHDDSGTDVLDGSGRREAASGQGQALLNSQYCAKHSQSRASSKNCRFTFGSFRALVFKISKPRCLSRQENAAEATERAGRAASDALRRNAETFSSTFRATGETASRIAERSIEQFSNMFGLSGDTARQTVQHSAASLQALVDSSTVVASGIQNVSANGCGLCRTALRKI